METRGQEVHIDQDEARAGSTPNVVRWVLGIGLLLAIIGLSASWLIPALTGNEPTMPSQNAEANVRAAQEEAAAGSDTDSIVGQNADEIDAITTPAPEQGGSTDVGNQPPAQ